MADTTFTFKIEGLDEMVKLFQKAPGVVEEEAQQAINRSAVVLATHTDEKTVPFRRGDLIRSFKPVDIGRLYARWFPRADYAKAIQYGMPASPGRFVPAIGKRLVNGNNIGTWPGFKGAHYMEKIMNASRGEINELFTDAVKRIVLIMKGGTAKDTQGGLINLMDEGASVTNTAGTTSAFSTALYKVSPKLGAKFDQLTYRPFKGAPRGYQARLGKKFPKLFKRWDISNM